jgi:23S rRNA (cytosine1962-C5)-methyltransferase
VAWGIWDEGEVAIRVLGREPEEMEVLLSRCVERAERARLRGLGQNTDGYRLVNGAGDGLPGLVVDRYGPLAVLRLYSAAWIPHLDRVVATIARLGWVETVFRRFGVARVDGEKGGETLSGPEAPETLVFQEHGLKFLVRPWIGQKTGFFLDQRENRRRIGELAPGRHVFNLFGYNGGFSVYAAAGGAARVLTVDQSGPALEDARENFRINGLDPDRHAFEEADVFSWVAPNRADLVISDPPSLARRQAGESAAKKAYRDLAAHTGAMVSVEGLLATASCTARLDRRRWDEAIGEGLRRVGKWSFLERTGAPLDHPVALGHPEGHYLKFALFTRLTSGRGRVK